MGLFRDFGGTHKHRFLLTLEESCNTLPEISVCSYKATLCVNFRDRNLNNPHLKS